MHYLRIQVDWKNGSKIELFPVVLSRSTTEMSIIHLKSDGRVLLQMFFSCHGNSGGKFGREIEVGKIVGGT